MKLEFEYNQTKLAEFFKSGIAVLTTILILSTAFYYVPQIVTRASGGNKKLPIYCVKTDKKQVALTFDAAWGNESTPKLLETLKKHGLKVTFFLTGGWVEKYPEDVKAIAEAGHDIGNHSQNHKQMSQLSETACEEEIMSVHQKVEALTGKKMQLFRAPFGDYNNRMLDVVNACGYHCIQWDVDSLDWKDYSAESIVKRICESKHLSNGSIILCHNNGKHTAEALEPLIVKLKEMGYEIVPVSQLIYAENYKIDHEGRQYQ